MIPKPLCYDHRDRETAPALCHTCARIKVERDIVTLVVDALIHAGFTLREREDGNKLTRGQLLSLLFDLDEAVVIAEHPEHKRPTGWVYFVFGNDGYDVISDYTTNLEDVLAPINAYADTLAV